MQKLLFPVTLFARKVRLSLNPIISDANPHVKADIHNRNRQIPSSVFRIINNATENFLCVAQQI